MIVRTGIDLVAISEVDDAVRDLGSRYLRRIFTEDELVSCTRRGAPSPRLLAGVFAAKEATIKALGIGPADAVSWQDIEVRRQATAEHVAVSGRAADHARATGVGTITISITTNSNLAAAIAVAKGGI